MSAGAVVLGMNRSRRHSRALGLWAQLTAHMRQQMTQEGPGPWEWPGRGQRKAVRAQTQGWP